MDVSCYNISQCQFNFDHCIFDPFIFISLCVCVCVIFPVRSATLDSFRRWKRNGHASNDGDLNKNSKVINPQTNSHISCSFIASSLDVTCVLLSSSDEKATPSGHMSKRYIIMEAYFFNFMDHIRIALFPSVHMPTQRVIIDKVSSIHLATTSKRNSCINDIESATELNRFHYPMAWLLNVEHIILETWMSH